MPIFYGLLESSLSRAFFVQFCCFSQGSFHVQNNLRLMIDYVIVGVGSNEQQYAHVRMNSNSI
jgi:hypothetical protein